MKTIKRKEMKDKNKILFVMKEKGKDFTYGMHNKDEFIKLISKNVVDEDVKEFILKRVKEKNVIMYATEFGGHTVGSIIEEDIEEILEDYNRRDIIFNSLLLGMKSRVEIAA